VLHLSSSFIRYVLHLLIIILIFLLLLSIFRLFVHRIQNVINVFIFFAFLLQWSEEIIWNCWFVGHKSYPVFLPLSAYRIHQTARSVLCWPHMLTADCTCAMKFAARLNALKRKRLSIDNFSLGQSAKDYYVNENRNVAEFYSVICFLFFSQTIWQSVGTVSIFEWCKTSSF